MAHLLWVVLLQGVLGMDLLSSVEVAIMMGQVPCEFWADQPEYSFSGEELRQGSFQPCPALCMIFGIFFILSAPNFSPNLWTFFQLFNAADWCKQLTIFMRIDYFSIPSISCSGFANVPDLTYEM